MEVFGPSLGADIVGEARAAEATGFSGVRVLDHLFCAINDGPVNTFDHPLVALGAAAAVTNRIVLTLDGPSAAWVQENVDTLKAVRTRDEVAAL